MQTPATNATKLLRPHYNGVAVLSAPELSPSYKPSLLFFFSTPLPKCLLPFLKADPSMTKCVKVLVTFVTARPSIALYTTP